VAHSINTVLWGTTGIVVGGIPIPDVAGYKQAQLAAIKPGDAVPSDAAPVIVMTGNKPSLAVASIGMSLFPETVRIVLGILGNHLSPQAAMAAPALLGNFQPWKPGETLMKRAQVVPAGSYDRYFLMEIRAAGEEIEEEPMQQVFVIKGTAVLGTIEIQSGTRQSVEIPGIFGFASAY
jgi:gamma-glutamyltranspeptidase/glutathione hydrolase